jgi:hypothetical protein
MKPLLPAAARPYAFAATQALVTTGVSTLIATRGVSGQWMLSWALAWVLLVPLVLIIAPLIWRLVNRLCETPARAD